MKIVLYQPQIPQNTGNIVRTCAVTRCDLILVKPLGFQITDRWLKRSGLDYWEHVNVEVIDNLESLLENHSGGIHLFTSKRGVCYTKKIIKKMICSFLVRKLQVCLARFLNGMKIDV